MHTAMKLSSRPRGRLIPCVLLATTLKNVLLSYIRRRLQDHDDNRKQPRSFPTRKGRCTFTSWEGQLTHNSLVDDGAPV